MENLKEELKRIINEKKGVINITDENIDFIFKGSNSFVDYNIKYGEKFEPGDFEPNRLLVLIHANYDVKLSYVLKIVDRFKDRFIKKADLVIFGVYQNDSKISGIENARVIAIK